MDAMTDVWNPADVEAGIREVSNRIGKGVTICANRYAQFLDADRTYDRAFAHAYMAHEGPAHEKKYAAELATSAEREARDLADAAYRFADRTSRALQDELRAHQSVNASIRATYQVAGVGER